MKIRNGFVSNSSTSSFLIYGVRLDESKLNELFGEDWYDKIDGMMYKETSKTQLESHHPYEWGSYYIGMSWNKVGNDETGAQFKAKTEEEIKKLIKTVFQDKADQLEVKFDTHEAAWHD